MDIPKPERFKFSFHNKGGVFWNKDVECKIEGHRDPQPPQYLAPYGTRGLAHDIERNKRTYDQVVTMGVLDFLTKKLFTGLVARKGLFFDCACVL